MAIGFTINKKQEDLNRRQGGIGSSSPYSGMPGVSQNTANNLGNYQGGYKPSETVTQANQRLAEVNAQRPQSFSGKYGPQLEGILKQIQNPGDFKYDFNGDEMFKYYADLYTQKGKQASMDAMGQAAALTGGYGNSYAQQVGQQGYQQYLLSLYDRGLDLYDRAYQRDRDRIGDMNNTYNILQDADARDYDKYRDTMADWQAERDYATGREDTERGFDYGTYADQLNYWTGMAQQENAAYNTEANRNEQMRQADLDESYRRDTLAENIRQADMDNDYRYNALAQDQRQFDATSDLNWAKLEEDQRQYDANLTEEQRQYNQSIAMDYASSILANGEIPSNELLIAAGLSREDAEKLVKKVTSGKGPGPETPPPAGYDEYEEARNIMEDIRKATKKPEEDNSDLKKKGFPKTSIRKANNTSSSDK